jgi:predicted MPP superfamily phosphohydrolase
LIGVIIISTIIIFAGYINFLNPYLNKFEISVPKRNSILKSLNIAVASDIHLGTMVRNSQLENLVDKINSLNPDIILLPGDIIDEDLSPVVKMNLGEKLKQLKAEYGVIGITGNHEYIGGVNKAVKYLQEHNVKMLLDSSIYFENRFSVVGRRDRSASNFSQDKRNTLSEIMKSVKDDLPVILMDHQPFDLRDASDNKIDLQLSGHTHHGQLWPLNFITSMIYEISIGYKKINNTHYYVSSGFAGWGPPVRTGSRTEIVNIFVNFE